MSSGETPHLAFIFPLDGQAACLFQRIQKLDFVLKSSCHCTHLCGSLGREAGRPALAFARCFCSYRLLLTQLLPKLLPIPHPIPDLLRQRESQLMREHAHLPAMVGFVSKHVAQHLHPNRPGQTPGIPAKFLDAPPPSSASTSISAHRAALSANPIPACCGVQRARLNCVGTFRCGAVSLNHLQRTLCIA
jgi:hypothetical protein